MGITTFLVTMSDKRPRRIYGTYLFFDRLKFLKKNNFELRELSSDYSPKTLSK